MSDGSTPKRFGYDALSTDVKGDVPDAFRTHSCQALWKVRSRVNAPKAHLSEVCPGTLQRSFCLETVKFQLKRAGIPMTSRRIVGLLICGVVGFAAPAAAQVVYQPYGPAPTPYGYPVPYGFLQPDETLGTSLSFQISPNDGSGPTVRVVQRCKYPNGWNATDFSRDNNGIPAGINHTCPVASSGGVRARY